MLSLLPELLFLAPFSALAIRVALAVVLALTAWKHASEREGVKRFWALVEAATAAALLAGAWTQAAALVAAVWLAASFFMPDMRRFPASTIALAIVLCLSLVVTGAGAFAFDWPL